MKKKTTMALCLVLAFVLSAPAARALDTAVPAQKAVKYYEQNKTLSSWWDVLALVGANEDVNTYTLPQLNKPEAKDVTGCAICLLTQMALGRDPKDAVCSDGATPVVKSLAALQKTDGSFGTYLNEHIYAILALEAASPAAYDREAAGRHLYAQQKADGGFTFYGDTGDVDMTGMALLALSCFRDDASGACTAKAVSFLKTARSATGGYISPWSSSGKESACSAAAAISGLAAAGTDFEDGQWDATVKSLLSCQLQNGAFAAEVGLTAPDRVSTQQALIALGDIKAGDSVFKRLTFKLSAVRRLYADGQDVDAQYASFVEKAYEYGIMHGTPQKCFLPKSGLKRSELAAVMARMAVTTEQFVAPPFEDIGVNDWFYYDAAKVLNAGLMSGIGGKFLPDAIVTRGELSAAALRVLEQKSFFTDPAGQLQAAVGEGVIEDIPGRDAASPVTREEAAAVFVRLKEKIG